MKSAFSSERNIEHYDYQSSFYYSSWGKVSVVFHLSIVPHLRIVPNKRPPLIYQK